jgi:hypothetical protein
VTINPQAGTTIRLIQLARARLLQHVPPPKKVVRMVPWVRPIPVVPPPSFAAPTPSTRPDPVTQRHQTFHTTFAAYQHTPVPTTIRPADPPRYTHSPYRETGTQTYVSRHAGTQTQPHMFFGVKLPMPMPPAPPIAVPAAPTSPSKPYARCPPPSKIGLLRCRVTRCARLCEPHDLLCPDHRRQCGSGPINHHQCQHHIEGTQCLRRSMSRGARYCADHGSSSPRH